MTKLRKAWLAVAVSAVITTMTGLGSRSQRRAAGKQKNRPYRINGAGHVQPVLLRDGEKR